jgi:hypothetical protein
MKIIIVGVLLLLICLLCGNNTEYFSNTYRTLYDTLSSSQNPTQLNTNSNNLYEYCENSPIFECRDTTEELRDQVINSINYGVHQFGRYPDKNMSLI